jgi:hypothetical protein
VLDEYASKFTSFGLNSVAWEMIKQRKRDMPYEILEARAQRVKRQMLTLSHRKK